MFIKAILPIISLPRRVVLSIPSNGLMSNPSKPTFDEFILGLLDNRTFSSTARFSSCLIRLSPSSLSIPELGIPTTTNLFLSKFMLFLYLLLELQSQPSKTMKYWLFFEDTWNLQLDHQSLGARVPRNEWEHLRNISRSGSILPHCNQQTHLWHI